MAVPENYVRLERDVQRCFKFANPRLEERDITDPRTKLPKTVYAYVMDVVELDGRPAKTTYSTISTKHKNELQKYHAAGLLTTRVICITKTGEGFRTEYTVEIH